MGFFCRILLTINCRGGDNCVSWGENFLKIDPFEPKTIEKTLRYASNSGTKCGSFLILLMMGLCVFTEFAWAWDPQYEYLGWAMTISNRGQLQIHPENSQIQYYCDGAQGVYKSFDGGKTWTHKANGYNPELNTHYCRLQISPFDSETLYLAVERDIDALVHNDGLYQSTDGGESWERIYTTEEDEVLEFFWVHPYIPDYMIASKTYGWDYDTFWSDDGGLTWTKCPDMHYRIAEVMRFVESVPGLVLAIFNSGMYYSLDDGKTWELYDISPPGRIRDISIHPDDPSFMYAAVDNGYGQHKGVYVTFDFGITWYLLKEMSFYVPTVRVDYSRGISIFTENWHSEDGGLTWYENPWLDWDVDSLSYYTFDPHCWGTVYKTSNFGIAVTRDNGWTWEQHAFNNYIGSCCQSPSNPDVIYATTGNSGVMKSVDGGRTWVTKSHGIEVHMGCSCIRIDPTDENIIYIGGLGCHGIYKSTDAGESWLKLSTMSNYQIEIDPFNPSVLYGSFLSEVNGLQKSIDGGETWSWTPWVFPRLDCGVDYIHVSPHKPDLVYIAGYRRALPGEYLWESRDGGETWSCLPVPDVDIGGIAQIDSDPFIPGVLYCQRDRQGMLISRDWGMTWSGDIDPKGLFNSNPEGYLQLDPIHPGHLIVKNKDKSTFYIPDLYRTCEGGYRWTNVAKRFYLLLVGREDPPAVYGSMGRYGERYDVATIDLYKITFGDPRPVIEMAGYGRTRLTETGGGLLQIMCDVSCPDCDPGYPEVELTYEGIPAGLYLNDKGIQGDETAGDGRYTIEVDIPVNVLSPATYRFGLVARDASGTISDRWPRLQVN